MEWRVFIYVIGLSHDVVTKLIDIEYKETGVNGEQYIKKIIQIPISLPKWDKEDITKLLRDFIKKNLIRKNYKDIIDLDLISTAVENNPREVKRFLNNFIIAYEIFHSIGNFKANELLLIQAIQLRWNGFYNLLMTNDVKFRKELSKYSQMDEDTLFKTLNSDEVKEENEKNYVLRIRKLLSNYKTDLELWNFLRKYSDTLSNISNLSIYRRSVEVGSEPTVQTLDKNQEAYALLKAGDIAAFNGRITEFRDLDLRGADLRRAILRGADLSEANLEKAILRGADLSEANLEKAILRGADLIRADLTLVRFGKAYLEAANLSESIIINPDFEGLRLNKDTIFSSAIIGNPEFVDYIRHYIRIPVEKIVDKHELKIKLQKRTSDERYVEDILAMSRLPEYNTKRGLGGIFSSKV